MVCTSNPEAKTLRMHVIKIIMETINIATIVIFNSVLLTVVVKPEADNSQGYRVFTELAKFIPFSCHIYYVNDLWPDVIKNRQ